VAEYLKRSEASAASALHEVRRTVSEMLSRIEREGMAAVRETPSGSIGGTRRRSASARTRSALRRSRSARRCACTSRSRRRGSDLRDAPARDTLRARGGDEAGRHARAPPRPRRGRRVVRPRRALPDARVSLHDRAHPEGGGRPACRGGGAAVARRHPPGDAVRDGDLGRRRDPPHRRRPGARAARVRRRRRRARGHARGLGSAIGIAVRRHFSSMYACTSISSTQSGCTSAATSIDVQTGYGSTKNSFRTHW
jgi:hypothetical protein